MKKYAICLETLERGFEWLVVPWEKIGARKFNTIKEVPEDYILLSVWPSFRSPVKQWVERGLNYIEIDYGYWGHNLPRRNTRRVTYNGSHNIKFRTPPYSRLYTLSPSIQEWKKQRGEYILLIEPHPGTFTERTGIEFCNWQPEFTQKIKNIWDGPIKWRRKPGGKNPSRWQTFQDDLAGCHAVIGERTMACCEAIMLGYPAYTIDYTISSLLMGTDLNKINNIELPDRSKWLEHVAWSQFLPEEFNNGTSIVEMVEEYQM
jgi:hypothetical protein